jgi:dihydrofolate reductase
LARPLPNRHNVVVTHGAAIKAEGVTTLRGLSDFDPASLAAPGADVFVIGGAQIYAQLLPRCAELILSVLPDDVEGDAVFPEFETLFEFRETLLIHPYFEVRRYGSRHV